MRRRVTVLKTKAAKVINEINNISTDFKVTAEHFSEGVFPWNEANQRMFLCSKFYLLFLLSRIFRIVSFKENFKIVDCWMLRKRNAEQIVQSKKEMYQFLKCIERHTTSIKVEIDELKKEANSLDVLENRIHHAAINIKKSELTRLKVLHEDALCYGPYFNNSNPIPCSDSLFDDDEDSDVSDDSDEEEEIFL